MSDATPPATPNATDATPATAATSATAPATSAKLEQLSRLARELEQLVAAIADYEQYSAGAASYGDQELAGFYQLAQQHVTGLAHRATALLAARLPGTPIGGHGDLPS